MLSYSRKEKLQITEEYYNLDLFLKHSNFTESIIDKRIFIGRKTKKIYFFDGYKPIGSGRATSVLKFATIDGEVHTLYSDKNILTLSEVRSDFNLLRDKVRKNENDLIEDNFLPILLEYLTYANYLGRMEPSYKTYNQHAVTKSLLRNFSTETDEIFNYSIDFTETPEKLVCEGGFPIEDTLSSTPKHEDEKKYFYSPEFESMLSKLENDFTSTVSALKNLEVQIRQDNTIEPKVTLMDHLVIILIVASVSVRHRNMLSYTDIPDEYNHENGYRNYMHELYDAAIMMSTLRNSYFALSNHYFTIPEKANWMIYFTDSMPDNFQQIIKEGNYIFYFPITPSLGLIYTREEIPSEKITGLFYYGLCKDLKRSDWKFYSIKNYDHHYLIQYYKTFLDQNLM